jgi:hypothetical protein
MLSRTSPNASVLSSSVFSSYDSTEKPYLSVVKNNRLFPPVPACPLHSDMVATLPYNGTSNIGFNPFAVSLYTSNLVLFATIKSNASLDVKFPTHECVTTVGFCACAHRDERK